MSSAVHSLSLYAVWAGRKAPHLSQCIRNGSCLHCILVFYHLGTGMDCRIADLLLFSDCLLFLLCGHQEKRLENRGACSRIRCCCSRISTAKGLQVSVDVE